MLIDIISSCTESLSELSELRNNALSVDSFEKSVNKLDASCSKLERLIETIQAMKDTGLADITLTGDQIQAMKDAINACGLATQRMDLHMNQVDVFSSLVDGQFVLMNMSWGSQIKALTNPIISYINVIQSLLDNKEEAERIAQSIKTGVSADPTPESIKTLKINIEKANMITSGYDMSDGVRNFIQKIRKKEATLHDLNDEVFDWIRQHHLERKIKIRF